MVSTVTGVATRVEGAIRHAAARTGVDFSYLFGQARVESGFRPDARARTSSATGLYQFIEQTWLATVQKHGAEHGLGWAASAIDRGANGRYHVADPGTRQAILDLRTNPEAAAAMAAEFAADNGAQLQAKLGRAAEGVDLYLAHFLGAGGAAKFLRAHDATPGAPAAAALPEAARANRPVFFRPDGSARSFAEIRDRFAAKLGNGAGPMDAPHAPFPSSPAREPVQATEVQLAALKTDFGPSTQASPNYARLAYLMLAELGA